MVGDGGYMYRKKLNGRKGLVVVQRTLKAPRETQRERDEREQKDIMRREMGWFRAFLSC